MNLKRLNPKFLKNFHISNMNNILGNVAYYSEEIIPIFELNLSSYITTDSLLANKQGKCDSVNLPPNSKTCTRFKKGDILVANIRPYLKKIWFADIDGGCSADVLVFKSKEGYLPNFLYYALLRDDFFVHSMKGSTGTKMPRGDEDHLLEFLIPDFDYAQQEKISQVLSVLDAKIALNNKINIELEAMAKLIYDYWFMQFDFPDENGNPYKSSGGKMVYNEELKRDIPEGWKVKNLMDIASFTNGLACQKYRPKDGEDSYPVIKIKEMGSDFSDSSERVSKNIPDKVIINNGDVLFSWSASLNVMIWAGGIGGLNQHIFKVTSDKYPRTFYYFEVLRYLKHFKMMAELRKTTMGHINQDHLEQSKIAIPHDCLVESLHEKLNPILSTMVSTLVENQKLTELRDWLLPMLMNGQVKILEN